MDKVYIRKTLENSIGQIKGVVMNNDFEPCFKVKYDNCKELIPIKNLTKIFCDTPKYEIGSLHDLMKNKISNEDNEENSCS